MRTLHCWWCGVAFAQPNARGPVPRYCCKGHRQRAYEERVVQRRIDAALEESR